MLLVGFSRRDTVEKVEIGFGVGKLLEFFDLQASVFVGNDVSDQDHLAGHVYPDRGRRTAGELYMRQGTHVSTSDVGSGCLKYKRERRPSPRELL